MATPDGVPVEWIGVRSPLDNPWVCWLKLNGGLTGAQLALLEEYADACKPLIRSDGSRARILRHDDVVLGGLSRDYQWGPEPGSYVQWMAREDAARVFRGPDEAEFRDHSNPAHVARTAQVPQSLDPGGCVRAYKAARETAKRAAPHLRIAPLAVAKEGSPKDVLEMAAHDHLTNGRRTFVMAS